MKSILQEDSSVINAIEKAWNKMGKPSNFTVRIINTEEKGFLGIVNKPALISLVCDSNVVSKDIKKTKFYKDKRHLEKEKRIQIINKEKIHKPVSRPKYKIETNKVEEEKRLTKRLVTWKDEYINDVIKWLSELLNIMGIKTQMDTKVDQKMLNIFLQDSIMKDADAQKMLFINLSNIVMQFLKKKYKKRFSNYYLIIKQKNEGKKESTNNK